MVSKTKSYWKGLQKKGRYRLFGQYRTNLVSKRRRMATTTEIKDTWAERKERKRTQRSCLKDGSSGRECPGHPGHPAPTACTPPALQALHLRWVCSPFHQMVWMKHTNRKALHIPEFHLLRCFEWNTQKTVVEFTVIESRGECYQCICPVW